MSRVELDQVIDCHEVCIDNCHDQPPCCHAVIAQLQAGVVYAVMIGESGCMDSGIHSLHRTESGATAEAERVNAERTGASGYLSKWDRAHVEEMEIRP